MPEIDARAMAEAAWWMMERGVTALLVLCSLPLLMLAVLASLLASDALAWRLFAAGIGCWAAGIGWGLLVNRVGPALARAG